MTEKTYTETEFYEMHAEYDAEYTALLETINTLKSTLRNIRMTALKADKEQAAALNWIEGECFRVLDATREELA